MALKERPRVYPTLAYLPQAQADRDNLFRSIYQPLCYPLADKPSSHSHHGKADESSDTHHFLHTQNDPADASYPQMYHPLFHERSVCLLTLFQMHLPMQP